MKDNLLANIKAGERFGKALDLSLDVLRKTPHTKLSAFKLHYGRKPNTERTNLLSLDNLKNLTKNSISAKPDTLQVYSFSGVGRVSDQLTMKTKKNDKGVGNYPFLFLEKKHQKSKFESTYTDKPNIAISGTNHTVTTPNGRIIHKKNIVNVLLILTRTATTTGNRVERTRRPTYKITIKTEEVVYDRIRQRARDITTRDKQPNNSGPVRQRYGEKEYVRPSKPLKLIKDRQNLSPHQSSPGGTRNTGPLIITAANMTDTEIDRAIEYARQANDEVFIRDNNGEVFKNFTSFLKTGEENNFKSSELDLASNLSSSNDLEADIKHEEEKTVRRSKRLTKTKPNY